MILLAIQMIWNIIKSTHSLENIWTLSWLSPRHALDLYKVDLPLLLALVSPSPSGLSSANPGGLLRSVSCLKLFDFSSPSFAFLTALCRCWWLGCWHHWSRCWFKGYLLNSGDYSVTACKRDFLKFTSCVSFEEDSRFPVSPFLQEKERVCLPRFLVTCLLFGGCSTSNTAGKWIYSLYLYF